MLESRPGGSRSGDIKRGLPRKMISALVTWQSLAISTFCSAACLN